jgi:hypothetical protein
MSIRTIRLALLSMVNPSKEDITNELMFTIQTTKDVDVQIKAFEAFKNDFEELLSKKREASIKVTESIDGFIPEGVNRVVHELYEDNKLKDIEVNYQLVKSN